MRALASAVLEVEMAAQGLLSSLAVEDKSRALAYQCLQGDSFAA